MSAIGHHCQTYVDERLEFDSLKVGEKESLGEDDLGRTVLVFHHTLKPVRYQLPQIVMLRKKNRGEKSKGASVVRFLASQQASVHEMV